MNSTLLHCLFEFRLFLLSGMWSYNLKIVYRFMATRFL